MAVGGGVLLPLLVVVLWLLDKEYESFDSRIRFIPCFCELDHFPATATTVADRRDLVPVDGGEGQVSHVVIFLVLG